MGLKMPSKHYTMRVTKRIAKVALIYARFPPPPLQERAKAKP